MGACACERGLAHAHAMCVALVERETITDLVTLTHSLKCRTTRIYGEFTAQIER